jgi:autotransporter-associated beta strand protein
MRPLDSSAHRWPALANLSWLVFVCVLGGSARAQTCNPATCVDLGGEDDKVTSLSDTFFSKYTNSALGTNPKLINGGASSTFSGVIVDGPPTATIGLTQNSTTGGTLTLTGANTYTGGTTITGGTLQLGAGGTTGSIVGNVTDNSALVFDRADNVTFSGAISGTGSVTQQGGGVLTLTGANTYAGGTTIAAGTVRADAVNALGSGGVTFSGVGALEANAPTVTTAVTINSGASATLGATAGNTLTLAGSFTIPSSGFFTTIQFGSAANTGTVAIDTAPTSSFSGAGAVIAGGTVQIGSLAGSFFGSMQAGVTVGSSAVAATLDLGAAVNAEVFNLSGNANGVITDTAGPTTLTTVNNLTSSTYAGVIKDGAGAISLNVINFPGLALTLSNSGGNTYSGTTTIESGATLLGGATNAFSAASATTVLAGGTLDLGGFNQTVSSLSGSGTVTNSGVNSAILTNQGASSTFSGVIQDGASLTGLTQNSAGNTLTLTGTNTYTGETTIAAGTLALGTNGVTAGSIASSSGVIDNGTFDISGTFVSSLNIGATITTLSGSGVVNLGPQTLTITNGSTTFGGVIADGGINPGSGSLKLSGGALTLTGNNTYTGGTTITGGTLQLGAGGTTGSIVGNVTNNSALVFDRSDTITFGGAVSGTGSVTQQGSGVLILSGDDTYSGPTTVQAGTLMGGATNAFSAASSTTVNPGGTLDLGGLGLTQTINTVNLAGGVVRNGALTSLNGITSTGGTVDGIGGTTGLTVNSGVTTLSTTTGANTYGGATTINGGTLMGGATNAFSAASSTTVNPGGTLDLGGLGLTQTINSVTLAGGVVRNGALTSVNGITSTGGTLNGVTVSTSGTDGHALRVGGSGSQVNLVGANTFTTQGAGAIGLYAKLGVISATGATNITTSGSLAYGVNADGAGGQIKLGSANVATAGSGAFGLFASDASASGVAGSISATGALNVTTTNPAAAAIGLQGNGASILATGGGMIASAGDAIEFLGGTNQTATFDSFNISTPAGDIVFADPSIATITFNNSTVDAGTGHLLDATGGSVITFNASASTLTGAMATDAVSKSNVNLTNGTVWNLTGPSNVRSLAVTNSAIVFAPPGAGGSFKTLTVNNYVGSGANIVLNTALGGSSSPTDRIVVSGGSVTGNTLLTIRNAGGVGAQTTGAGIPIVTTTSGGTTASDAFALANTPVVNGHRYTLDDSGGDWYLVSSPTTTQAQVQSSLNAVSKAQLGQIVNNTLLSSILLGATQQVSCSNCASGFGALGSFALGTQGRVGLSDRLTAIGGFSYNQWSSSGISVYDAPTFAGSLLYDFDNFGSSRPFVEAGGSLTPYESIHGSRVYPNGLTMATGNWTSLDRNLSLFARAGWVARLTPIDEAAAYADLGRNWLQTGGYTEATTATNPFPASAASALQGLNTVRLGAQYTHLFADNIEVNVSGAVAHGFGAGGGFVVNVTDFGPIGPTALPTTTWFEYGARVGYRLSDSLVVDAFVLGAVGDEVGSTVHGGMALRVAF